MTGGDRPSWWAENEQLRDELGLSEYVPPRFEDDVYTHEVVADLEASHDVEIRFLGVNASYGDEWEVRADGESLLQIGRHRDETGNTVYEMPSDEFVARLSAKLDEFDD